MKAGRLRELGLSALAFAVPVEIRIGKEVTGLVSVSLVETLVLALFFAWIGINASHGRREGLAPLRSMWTFIAYAAWALLVSLYSRDLETAQITRDIFVALLLLAMVVYGVQSAADIRRVLAGFMAGVFFNCLLGLLQIAFDWPRIISLEAHGAVYKEDFAGENVATRIATGLFSHPNGFALVLALALSMLTARLLYRERRTAVLVLLPLLGIFLFNLYFTQGKGAVVWLAVGIGGMLVQKALPRRLLFPFAVGLVVAVIAVLVYVVLPGLLESGRGGTIATRQILWQVAWAEIVRSPSVMFFGGAHHAIVLVSGQYSSFEYGNAHNTFLNQAVYFGIVGLGFYLLHVLRALFRMSALLRAPQGRYWSVAVWSALVVLSGELFFEPLHQGAGNLGMIALLTGLPLSRYCTALLESPVVQEVKA